MSFRKRVDFFLTIYGVVGFVCVALFFVFWKKMFGLRCEVDWMEKLG